MLGLADIGYVLERDESILDIGRAKSLFRSVGFFLIDDKGNAYTFAGNEDSISSAMIRASDEFTSKFFLQDEDGETMGYSYDIIKTWGLYRPYPGTSTKP